MTSLIPGLTVLVDQAGNYITSTVGQVPPTTNAAGATTSTYAAVLQGGLNSAGVVTPISLDATGAAVVRTAMMTSITFAPTAAINTTAAAGKSMLSIYNASTANNARLVALYLMCPPQQAVSGGLLGTSTSYTTVGMAVQRFTTAHTGGTVIAGALHDSRDTADAQITCRTGATIAGVQPAALRVFDAAYSSIVGYGHREDDNVRLWTMLPGEGLNCTVLSAVGSPGVNFYVTAVIAQSIA